MWAHFLNGLLGLWLMAAPGALGYGPPAATSDRIAGPFIATLSFVAVAQCTRALRHGVVPFSLWLIVAPWVMDFPTDATINGTIVGVATAALAFVPGRITRQFGGGWIAVLRKDGCGRIEPEPDTRQPPSASNSTSTIQTNPQSEQPS